MYHTAFELVKENQFGKIFERSEEKGLPQSENGLKITYYIASSMNNS